MALIYNVFPTRLGQRLLICKNKISSIFPPYKYKISSFICKYKISSNIDNLSLPVTQELSLSCSVYMLYVNYHVSFSVDDDLENKVDYSLNCVSCFIHILNYKITIFFGICFFLYFLKLLAGRVFYMTYTSTSFFEELF